MRQYQKFCIKEIKLVESINENKDVYVFPLSLEVVKFWSNFSYVHISKILNNKIGFRCICQRNFQTFLLMWMDVCNVFFLQVEVPGRCRTLKD